MAAKPKQGKDMKGEFLSELVERYNYWHSIGTTEADNYASAYERLICAFTMPDDDKKG